MRGKEAKERRQVDFDLNQAALKEHYPKPKFTINPQYYKKAYDDVYKFFKSEGWAHRQGSVYTSVEKLSNNQVVSMLDRLAAKLPWLSSCINEIDIAEVKSPHSLKAVLETATAAVKMSRPKKQSDQTHKQERSAKPATATRAQPEQAKKPTFAKRQANAQTRIEAQSNARNGRSPNKNNEER